MSEEETPSMRRQHHPSDSHRLFDIADAPNAWWPQEHPAILMAFLGHDQLHRPVVASWGHTFKL